MRTAAAAALVVVSITSGSGTSEAFKVKVGSRNNWFTLHNGMVLTFETDRPLEWRLKAGSAGKLETSGTTVRYVAPTGIPAHNSVAGCQVAPNDSVFNTAIDALPVHAESDAWIVALNTLLKGPVRISFPQGIGINIVNNSTAPARQTFHYTTARNGARYQIPKPPERKRETGALTTDANNDHHMISVNQETCHVYETYQDGLPGENWSAASGWDYDGTSYNSTGRPEDGGGSTDAAALPILPLLLRLSDFESGEIRHAMRFTACVGCISHSSVWPAGGTTGWGKGVPPMGSRWRLKASFDISRFSPRAQIILKALQRYGMIMADIGTVNQIQVSSDFNEDPSAMAALAEASNSALNTSAFEIVDESSLMLARDSYRVNPNNPYVLPDGLALLEGIDSRKDTLVAVLTEPAVIGVRHQNLVFQAGAPAYKLDAWVRGVTDHRLKWSLEGAGSVTQSGAYTPPASVSGAERIRLTATAEADPAGTAVIVGTVVPAGPIRIDIGNPAAHRDSAGHLWLADTLGFECGSNKEQVDQGARVGKNDPDSAYVYNSWRYSWGDDFEYGPFVLKNGRYQVTFMFGLGQATGPIHRHPFDNGLIWGPLALEAQGQDTAFDWVAAARDHRSGVAHAVEAEVNDGLLKVAVRATGGANTHSAPLLNGLVIEAE